MTRKRILVVNCYFPETREALRLTNEIPNALAPVLLAAEFYLRLKGAGAVFCAKLHHHNSKRCIFRCRYQQLISSEV